MGQSKFTISLLGFDERSAETLAHAARATMKVVDPISKEDTQVTVIDIDEPNGIGLWNEFRKQWPHMPAVVVCSEDPNFDNASFAEKPFTVETLIDNITEAIILAPSVEETSSAFSDPLPEMEKMDALAASDSSSEMDDWIASEENAPSDEPAFEMDELSPALNTSDAVDSFSSTDAISVNSDTITEIDTLAFQPILETTAEVTSESEQMNPISADVSIANMDEPAPELALSETTDQLSTETSTLRTNDDAAVPAEDINDSNETISDLQHAEETTNKIASTGEPATKDSQINEKQIRPLSEIANVLTSRSSLTGALPNRTLDSPNPGENFFNPDVHMIGLVLKGVAEGMKSGSIAKLACLLDKTIYIDARNKIVSSNLKDIHMRQIAIAPLGKGENGLDTELEMIASKSIEQLSVSESSIYPMESFIWELALLTSKGRVPVGTPMDKPTYLMQWPNFTRLMQSPNDMKIAAYWLRLPSSLLDLSENLNVPINDVRLMYSAAFLTGLAGLATRKSDNMLRPGKPEAHKDRNLFGSVINKFKK